MVQTFRLPGEWEPQDAVLFAWPHEGTDWAEARDRVVPAFAAMIRAVSRTQRALVLAPEAGPVQAALEASGAVVGRVCVVELATNDTWTRDFGPLTLVDDAGGCRLMDFRFNGWGGKFAAELDDGATAVLHEAGVFGAAERVAVDLVLEGGSIESNGAGELLTTTACLLAPGRNEGWTRERLDAALKQHLASHTVHWLEHGHLEGDDTDGHVDTLARFVGPRRIAYVRCDDRSDVHWRSFAAMEEQLCGLRAQDGAPFELAALPWPSAKVDAAGRRLPASYANFLIVNGAVLVPTYRDPADQAALRIIGGLFPERQVIGIDCGDIIEQSGAVHCLTMQLPRGVLASDGWGAKGGAS